MDEIYSPGCPAQEPRRSGLIPFGEGFLRWPARIGALQLRVLTAGTERDIDAAFASLEQQPADALIVQVEPFLARRSQIVPLVAQHSIPAISGTREFAWASALGAYRSGHDLRRLLA